MKNVFTQLVLGLLGLCTSFGLYAGGGPDDYGYVWLDSGEPGGPTYSWIDITTSGTLVSGLADDNTVGPFNIGFDFHYYWNDYNQIKLGSNGWFSFDVGAGNVAHCFPDIPAVGGNADDMIAPFLTDLNFAGATNPGEVYYYTNNVDTFILSFINAPWWVAATPDFNGSNTFQVILSGVDSSITFQYNTMDPAAFNNTAGCAQDLVIGIENVTGDMGLRHSVEMVPANNYAVKYFYPDSVLAAVPDNTPNWNQNEDNKGEFVLAGSFDVRSNIKNVGNEDILTATFVEAEIRNLPTTPVYGSIDTIPGLAAGDDTTLTFSPSATILTAGQYYYEVRVSNTTDLNPTNDLNTTELAVVDLSGGFAELTYCTNNPPDGSVLWTGGGGSNDGAGIFVRPPFYPININSIDMFIRQQALVPANNSGYTVEVWDDDGPDGSAGTLLESVVVGMGTYTPESWVNTPMSTPITIDSGGYYVAWRMGGDSVALGTEAFGPISRRSYEILSGAFAEYRQNTAEDFLIRSNISLITCAPSAAFTYSDTAFTVDFTNASAGATSYLWQFGDSTTDTAANPTHVYTTGGLYEVCLISSDSCGTDTACEFIDVCPAPGADFSASSTGDSSYTFTNLTTGSGFDLLWNFDDGDTTTMTNPSHTFPGAGMYNVCLIATSICGSDTFCDSITVTGIGMNEWMSESVKIFPNPSNGLVHILMDEGGNGSFNLEILDLHGRIMKRESFEWITGSKHDLDLTGLARGLYFIRMTGANGMLVRKLELR